MNIGTLLTKSARAFPNNPAIAHGPKKLTYAQFNSRTNRLANALYKLGIRQGDNIALVQYMVAERCPLTFGFIPMSLPLSLTTRRPRP
jgi:non-ribosomal peptide synthetase component E (peptide arylation enzyme)